MFTIYVSAFTFVHLRMRSFISNGAPILLSLWDGASSMLLMVDATTRVFHRIVTGVLLVPKQSLLVASIYYVAKANTALAYY